MAATHDDAVPPPDTLDRLIVEVATTLMPVGSDDVDEATSHVLTRLGSVLGVDHVVLRCHDHDRGLSILVAEEPPRPFVPDPDPLAEVPKDADPAFAATFCTREVVVIQPGDIPDYDARMEAVAGSTVTVAAVPLLQGEVTAGSLLLIGYGHRDWSESEIRALTAVGALFAQLWARLAAERAIRALAYDDPLTGLANRQRLVERLDDLPDGTDASILVVGIDGMKVVNDGLTYELGNQFLRCVAERLVAEIRPDDLAVRLDGDRFAVLVPDLDARPLADRLLACLAAPVDLGDIAVSRSVSVGIASGDPHGTDLVTEAGTALHLAKQHGKRRIVTFDEGMRTSILDRFHTELELRTALDEDQLLLHYQPEFDLRTGAVVAVEALLRWQHPTRGLLTAGAFIDAAEQSGFVAELGDLVLDRAIAQLAAWRDDLPDLEMWINVSPAQLVASDFGTNVAETLRRHGVPADRVCLEVTEHSVLDDVEVTIGTLSELREIGVKVALDDFGTGYSSMQQLKQLPISSLKVDMSFVAGLGSSAADEAIIDATITLARAFGLETVAEGIETEEQRRELVRLGCERGQGYLLARPMPPGDIPAIVGAASVS